MIDSPEIDIIMTNPHNPPIDKEVTDINEIDSNRQYFLSLIDKVIFQK